MPKLQPPNNRCSSQRCSTHDDDKDIKAVKDGKQLEKVVRTMCVSRKPGGRAVAYQTKSIGDGPDQSPGSLSGKTLRKPSESRPYGDGLDWLFQRKEEEPPSKRARTKDSVLKAGKIRKVNLKERSQRKK